MLRDLFTFKQTLFIRLIPIRWSMMHEVSHILYFLYLEQKSDGPGGIVGLFKHLDSNFDTKRVCIKIPSTWEGLQACRLLESTGTTTLATTLFSIEQFILAGEVGCHYIAPYVNELKVHFEPGYCPSS